MEFKKTITTFSFIIALFTLTGCMNVEINAQVNSNGETIEVENIIEINKEKLSALSSLESETSKNAKEQSSNTDICALLQESYASDESSLVWKSTKDSCITKDRYKWTYDGTGKVFEERDGVKTEVSYVKVIKKGDKVNFTIDLKDSLNDEMGIVTFDSFIFTLNYPTSIDKASAAGLINKSDNKATWDLKKTFKESSTYKVEATGAINGLSNFAQVLVGALVVIILFIGALMYFLMREKSAIKKTKEDAEIHSFEEAYTGEIPIITESLQDNSLKEFDVPYEPRPDK